MSRAWLHRLVTAMLVSSLSGDLLLVNFWKNGGIIPCCTSISFRGTFKRLRKLIQSQFPACTYLPVGVQTPVFQRVAIQRVGLEIPSDAPFR